MNRFYLLFLLLFPVAQLSAQMTPPAAFPGPVVSHVSNANSEYALIGFEEQLIHPAELGLLESYMEAMPVAGVTVIIKENSPADGILACSDVITAVNGHRVCNWYDLRLSLDDARRGLPIPVTVWRNDAETELELTVPVPKAVPKTRWVSGEPVPTPRIIPLRPIKAILLDCYGWMLRNFDESEKGGVIIVSVKPLSVAANAGFQAGDVILACGDKEISMRYEMDFVLRNVEAFDFINFTVQRGKELLPLRLVKTECEPEALSANYRIGPFPLHAPEFSASVPPALLCLQNSNQAPVEREAELAQPVENEVAPASFQVYPNPADGRVTVRFDARPLPFVLFAFDATGKQLYTEQVKEFDGHYQRDLDLQAKGTVYFQLQQDRRVFSQKLILQ